MGEENKKEKHVLETILWMIITALVVFIITSFYYQKTSLGSDNISYYTASGDNFSGGNEFDKLKKVYHILKKDFLFDFEVEKLEDAAISGMLDALEDPYTTYFTKSEAENFLLETTEGEYEGIGIYLSIDVSKNLAIVLLPIKNSPAAEAGVLPGDYIIEVGGKDVTNATIEEVAALIKGEKGSIVNIKFRRYDDEENYTEFEKEIERRSVDLNPFEYEIMEGNIGYIAFESFDDRTYTQFKNAYKDMEDSVKGLIIDLRGNPGGLLDCAKEILDEILPTGVITYTVDKNGNKEYLYSDSKCISIPVVVLVNENSASAAEITAAAIKDWDNGTVVGTTTFGKGLVQALRRLGDGTYVKVTISEYFSPNGEKINEIGVIPDYEVEDDKETEEDEQLQKAIEIMKEKIG
ncbi:MAG: S41 family peptidase [Clostridia bacterium]|nr:S41 family peptidase [Clostridia bacterium]